MATVVGNTGLEGVPSLQNICDLYRAIVNDTFNNGAGQINTDAAPWMKPFLNSAIRDLYSDLRMVADMRVVKDNYIISNIPPVTANPATQVAITYQGYYNGMMWSSDFTLPPDLLWLSKLWQRPSGTQSTFYPMTEAPAGLYGGYQGPTMGAYEVRGNNELWLSGATQAVDLRLRYVAAFPDIVGDNIDFSATYVPIQDCTNAVAHKMVANYAQRLSPDQFSLADSRAKEFTKKLVTESVRQSQNKEFERKPFGVQQ
jgi:hypothetical protein